MVLTSYNLTHSLPPGLFSPYPPILTNPPLVGPRILFSFLIIYFYSGIFNIFIYLSNKIIIFNYLRLRLK